MDKDYYIQLIKKYYLEEPVVVKTYYKRTRDKDFSIDCLNQKDVKELRILLGEIKTEMKVANSVLTIEEIKLILLASETQQNIALQAFTKFNCDLCSNQEIWHNSAVPRLCDDCREKAAINIIRSGILEKVLKNKLNYKKPFN